jgi:hypothetical protein
MHFGTKSYLKSTRNHIAKHSLRARIDLICDHLTFVSRALSTPTTTRNWYKIILKKHIKMFHYSYK